MAGELGAAVIDDQVGGVQVDADLTADQPDRYRVSVRADGDLAVAVDARPEPSAGLEWFVRQRGSRGCSIANISPIVCAREPMRRASSTASQASTMALSCPNESTSGTGTR
jgi:hypothetical protein